MEFFGFELKHEIGGEARAIAFYGLEECADRDFIEKRKVGTEEDLLAPKEEDFIFDAAQWDCLFT